MSNSALPWEKGVTRTRVAALVLIPLAIIIGLLGGRYWHVTHSPKPQVATLADQPVTAAPAPITTPPDTSSAPAQPAPQVATRDPAAAAAPSPRTDAPRSSADAPADRSAKAPAGTSAANPSTSPAPDDTSPSFDVVRVEPQGDAVVAGKGAPNAKVALLSGGKVVGEAKSDANGQFVILPQRLAPGDHALTLRQMPDGAPARESKQSVAVSVPKLGKDRGKPLVALAEPGKATKLLSPLPGASGGAATPAEPAGKVIIRSAELENGSGVYVSGAAPAGTSVHVYLNNSHIADVVAGADGDWSVRVKHGLTGGHYSVRADAAGPNGKVTARAEVPFDVPVLMAQTAKPAVAPPASAAAAPTKPGPAAHSPEGAAPTSPESREPATNDAAASASSSPAPSRETATSDVGGPASSSPSPSHGAAPTDAGASASSSPAPLGKTSTNDAAPAASPSLGATATAPAPSGSASSSASTADATTPSSSSTQGSNATIESIATALVTRGDNLWNISRYRLGDGLRYTQIYAANLNQIRDPNLIYPGQVFVVPTDR